MLREDVIIRTTTGELRGHLFVGQDHLPELAADERAICGAYAFYRPATVPNAWRILLATSLETGLLLESWYAVQGIQARLATAQREADAEERDQARDREIDARISQELDHE